MPDKRTTAHVRADIETERSAVIGEIHGLRQGVTSVLPFAVGTALALAVITRSKTARAALKILWWLR